ncbi:MAG: anti-sigma factor [Acidimicrobiia bacterium]|nr:anti-sigma factor [Acidimicrobiia bacterium]
MSDRNEVESLLGAYALDALSLEETRRVETALTGDAALRDAVAPLFAVAAALAEGAAGPADPPPRAVWARIAAATAPPRPNRAATLSAWRRWLGAVVASTAVAAAVVLAFVAVGQHGRLLEFERGPLAAAAAAARDADGSRVVTLSGDVAAEIVLAADGTGYLLNPEAPPLPADETYQLWAIVGDRVISAGVLGPNPGVSAFHVSGEVAGFALTVEVAGGVVSSEQDPVALGLMTG